MQRVEVVSQTDMKIQHASRFVLLVFLISVLVGCAPTVHLNTPEPIKIDVAVRVDVHEHGATVSKMDRSLSAEESFAPRRREDRSGQIWAMKNDGAVVEGDNGYLEVLGKSGWDLAYVKKLADEENHDRKILYNAEARDSGRALSRIEKEAGQRLRQQAYGAGVNAMTGQKP